MTRHTWHAWHTPHNFQAASYQPVHSMLIPEMVQSINTGLPVITNLRTMKKKFSKKSSHQTNREEQIAKGNINKNCHQNLR